MTTSPEYLIDAILPSREVHLLAGSSGSGKSTFLFQTLAQWQDGFPVLGHASHPVPYLYVSIDRSRASVTRTLTRLGLEDKVTRILCTEDLGDINGLGDIIRAGHLAYPDTKLWAIEGWLTMAGEKGNSYFPVYRLLSAATRFCVEQDATIIGVCHTPKIKKGEEFKHGRENVMGSVAWGGFGDTVVYLDQNESNGVVTMSVMPRNAAKEEFKFVFGANGVLTPCTSGGRGDLELHLYGLGAGEVITRAELLTLGRVADVSRSTVDRIIADSIESGVIAPVHGGQEGTYRRVSDDIFLQ